jgi:hypothetical protein
MIEPIFTKESFHILVEKLVREEHQTYIEAIISICDENSIEYADIVKLIPPPMVAKLEAEGISKNILPRVNDITAFF